ncbi:hypothetical protein [Parvularcula lutaonensis]|uniref:Uncharacterized protein n=1 Tax=Parvularcula lutaonensis TaxID=491923 RepID=A0ABV7M827_9PROT|nr:hypothetical protein GCM10007148_27450 [Parvularcula lutaonensis]
MMQAERYLGRSAKTVTPPKPRAKPRAVSKAKPVADKPNGGAFGGFLGAAP